MTKKTLAILAAIAKHDDAASAAIRKQDREMNEIMKKIPFREK